jgi:uncharacterized membrane protein YgdD (TMEM256/DUF423 family)
LLEVFVKRFIKGLGFMSRIFLLLGSALGFIAVALGAFGAHGLEAILSPERLEVYQTGVQYQMFHVTALLVVGVLCHFSKESSSLLKWTGYLFIVGILLFSGSLYLLTLTGVTALGMITPLGGVAFLMGWGFLFYHVYKQANLNL